MDCPHCSKGIHEGFRRTKLNAHAQWAPVGTHFWWAAHMTCPACKQAIIYLQAEKHPGVLSDEDLLPFLVFPASTTRGPVPAEVPADIAEDYHEACAVIAHSPKASAALSRRCLQAVLRGNGYAHRDLAPAIDAALAANQLPSAIAENLDAIRAIGNFAAHPMKDTNTGEILPVEPHEAEWNLDVLEQLFDFYYVQPIRAKARRSALDMKLAAAGKPPMKGTPTK
ncbi:DUF4145 domain-containing protein [Burkholderia cepacia]|uniref:DUF4145 domain-containing protein n=1 Tax=Burkholderia cepacia TaxID=292 RepID=UPI0007C71208|nr:DUF4145 domain-containing protein [Burkholderia cepacia]MCA8321932.1 DUF4145 domain-containing protein [Burkholderia cepacia]